MDHPLPYGHKKMASKEDEIIGKLVAENLVENGATLQMGMYLVFW